jgi:hypothetical protein
VHIEGPLQIMNLIFNDWAKIAIGENILDSNDHQLVKVHIDEDNNVETRCM